VAMKITGRLGSPPIGLDIRGIGVFGVLKRPAFYTIVDSSVMLVVGMLIDFAGLGFVATFFTWFQRSLPGGGCC